MSRHNSLPCCRKLDPTGARNSWVHQLLYTAAAAACTAQPAPSAACLQEQQHASVQADALPHAIAQHEPAVEDRHFSLWAPHQLKAACASIVEGGWQEALGS